MKISYKWLKDLLNFNLTAEETAAYLTDCGTTGIENHQSQITNHKYLKDNRLYIEVYGQIYSITGQTVQ